MILQTCVSIADIMICLQLLLEHVSKIYVYKTYMYIFYILIIPRETINKNFMFSVL